MRSANVRTDDRVVLVGDWMKTGSQAAAVRHMVECAGAQWVECAVIVDEASEDVRQRFGPLRSIVEADQLP